MKIGIVSGFFNPLHLGHIEYINSAKNNCDYLIVIINNDFQVKLKKSKPFMTDSHREKIISNLKSVNDTIISIDNDETVRNTLIFLKYQYPNDELYFFNSGDRTNPENSNIAEIKTCEDHNIKYIVIPLKKIYSSSQLLMNVDSNTTK